MLAEKIRYSCVFDTIARKTLLCFEKWNLQWMKHISNLDDKSGQRFSIKFSNGISCIILIVLFTNRVTKVSIFTQSTNNHFIIDFNLDYGNIRTKNSPEGLAVLQ